jgi:hypothetical protein
LLAFSYAIRQLISNSAQQTDISDGTPLQMNLANGVYVGGIFVPQ